jgi:fibronectin type 3 domain-containing protein
VQLSDPNDPQETSMSLLWTQAHATNFAFYRIVRADTAGALTAPTRVNVSDISSVTTTTYTDQGLEQNKDYYYQVLVYDQVGAFAASNEVRGHTKDLAPVAVTLETPTAVSQTELTLSWSKNDEDDFASYKIYRSTEPSVDVTDQLIATITRSDVTTYRDSGLQENTRYYYRVFVFDNGGTSSPSNEVGPRTLNAPPTAVTLTGNATDRSDEVDLNWTENHDHDFLEYRIYRDQSPSVGTNSTLARAVTERTSLAFLDHDLQENTRYYYRVFVADNGDSVTASNEISVLTANDPPAPVALSLVDTTHTSVTLSWTLSDASDFASYQLFMQTTPGVSTSGTPYATVTQRNRQNIVVTGLSRTPVGETPGQDYFFVVVVEDDAGGRTPSNELRVRGESP